MSGAHRLPFGLRVRLLLRSFLLQASWNFEQMQGLGVAYVLAPALRRLHSGEALKKALARQIEYFNTHPYLASAILGATLRIEEEAATEEAAVQEAAEFRQIMMAPCAAMGDALFWGAIRPLAAVAALFFAINGSLLAPFVLLLVFNLPHLGVRIVGLVKGYESGAALIDVLTRCRFPDHAIRIKQVTLILLGALCADLVTQTFTCQGLDSWWGVVILPILLLLGWPTRKSISPLLLALAAAAGVLAVHSIFRS